MFQSADYPRIFNTLRKKSGQQQQQQQQQQQEKRLSVINSVGLIKICRRTTVAASDPLSIMRFAAAPAVPSAVAEQRC